MCRVPYCTLPFDIALADLSWEFTLFGDVDVSTESLGLPDIPVDLALKLSWVGHRSVTLHGSTFAYSVDVTATLDFESAGIEVYLMVGRVKTSLVCQTTCLRVLSVVMSPRCYWCGAFLTSWARR